MPSVQIGRPYSGVAKSSEIAVAEIVGEQNNDVRLAGSSGSIEPDQDENETNSDENSRHYTKSCLHAESHPSRRLEPYTKRARLSTGCEIFTEVFDFETVLNPYSTVAIVWLVAAVYPDREFRARNEIEAMCKIMDGIIRSLHSR